MEPENKKEEINYLPPQESKTISTGKIDVQGDIYTTARDSITGNALSSLVTLILVGGVGYLLASRVLASFNTNALPKINAYFESQKANLTKIADTTELNSQGLEYTNQTLKEIESEIKSMQQEIRSNNSSQVGDKVLNRLDIVERSILEVKLMIGLIKSSTEKE